MNQICKLLITFVEAKLYQRPFNHTFGQALQTNQPNPYKESCNRDLFHSLVMGPHESDFSL